MDLFPLRASCIFSCLRHALFCHLPPLGRASNLPRNGAGGSHNLVLPSYADCSSRHVTPPRSQVASSPHASKDSELDSSHTTEHSRVEGLLQKDSHLTEHRRVTVPSSHVMGHSSHVTEGNGHVTEHSSHVTEYSTLVQLYTVYWCLADADILVVSLPPRCSHT